MSTDPLRHLSSSLDAVRRQQEHARRVAAEAATERERAQESSASTPSLPSSSSAPARSPGEAA
jgi:hypothetical protein